MTPGERQAMTGLVRETLARARDTARSSAEILATAAELVIIAEDLCSRARAARERAQELGSERLGRTSPAAVTVPTSAIRGPRQGGRRA